MKIRFPNPLLKLSVIISSYVMASGHAFAQAGNTNNLASFGTTVSSNMYSALDMVSTCSYGGAACFGVSAAWKAKAHMQDPGQTPIGHVAGRGVAAAALAATPYMIGVITASMGTQANNSGIDGISGSVNRF